MSGNQISGLLLLITLLLGIGHLAYYHPQLPDKVAIHFNFEGKADRFASRNVHTSMMIGLQTGVATCLVGIGYLLRLLPASLINIPNREYWLAPDRRQKSTEKLRLGLSVMAIGTQLFLIGINHITIMQNLGRPEWNWFWPLLTGYLVFVVGFCLWLAIEFRLPTDEVADE